jgi:hypothetical protein
MVSADSTRALIAPLWLAQYPWAENGETDIEYYRLNGSPRVRYVVHPYVENATDNAIFDVPFYPAASPFSKSQINIIEWSGDLMRFVTDVFDPHRIRAHDFVYAGPKAPGQSGQNMYAYITLHGTYAGGPSDELVVKGFGSYALDHSRSDAAASSVVNSAWPAANVIDASSTTAWSSGGHSSADAYEWLAVWHGQAKSTNYIRIVPRINASGVVLCVPEYVHIYYSANGTWNYLQTVNLPATLSRAGHTIDLPTTTNDGYLLTTSRLRADDYGNYYFQVAEVYSGLRQ